MASKKLSIKMEDLLDALDRPEEFETEFFLDTQTGEVLVVGSEYLRDEEGVDGLDEFGPEDEGEFDDEGDLDDASLTGDRDEPDWIRKEREVARRIAEGGDRYRAIEPFGRHEAYRLMEHFIGTVDDPRLSERLRRAISGRGAFRHFKDTLADHNMLDRWYAYERQHKLEFARDWLESIGIEPT